MSKTLHFKIVLLDVQPMIWRTFVVTDGYRLDRFHQVIQLVMGWYNAHLHEFEIKNRKFGMLLNDGFDVPGMEDENHVYLRDLDIKPGDTILYLYDFGDSWEHIITLEKIEAQSNDHPICTGGENACPPEDCGGFPAHMALRQIFVDPSHEEYDDLINWLPEGYHPDFFPLEAISKELEKFGKWHRKHPRKVSTPWHQV